MLSQAVDACPEELWTSGTHPRNFWRIAYHAVFYTHLYAHARFEDFTPWEKHREHAASLWEDPPLDEPYTRHEIQAYVLFVQDSLSNLLSSVDFASTESGFSWYPSISKLEHQIMNVRHLQGHVGQLSEILMAHGVESDWIGKVHAEQN